MGSVRARRSAKASVTKATRRTKDKQREANIRGSAIIAENWDYSKTLAQNYKILGLTSKLGKTAGGDEADLTSKVMKKSLVRAQTIADIDSDDEESDTEVLANDVANPAELNADGEYDEAKIPAGEARITRDSEGKVIKVYYGKKTFDIDESIEALKQEQQANNELAPKTKVVKELEDYANRPIVREERVQSTREMEWMEQLYRKYGDDYRKMSLDHKLNVNQQTANDLKRRVIKWKLKNNIE